MGLRAKRDLPAGTHLGPYLGKVWDYSTFEAAFGGTEEGMQVLLYAWKVTLQN